jgi:hypothetical protein
MAVPLLRRGGGKETVMPEKKTIERARQDKREGKAPTTQAGAFVREEMEHIREGMHGAKNPKQAIAIGLSKARRAGVQLPPPPAGRSTSAEGEGEKKKRPARRRTAQAKRGAGRGAKATARKSSAKRARGAKRPARTSPKSRTTTRAARSSATSRARRQGRQSAGRHSALRPRRAAARSARPRRRNTARRVSYVIVTSWESLPPRSSSSSIRSMCPLSLVGCSKPTRVRPA